jgi:hypothetical protein
VDVGSCGRIGGTVFSRAATTDCLRCRGTHMRQRRPVFIEPPLVQVPRCATRMPETECSTLDKLLDVRRAAQQPLRCTLAFNMPSARCRQRRSIVGTVFYEMQRSRAVYRPHSGGLAISIPKHRGTYGYTQTLGSHMSGAAWRLADKPKLGYMNSSACSQ